MQDLLINTLTQEKMLSKKYLTHFKNENNIRMIFVGDIMMSRNVKKDTYNYFNGDYNRLLEEVKPFFNGADVVFGNLENPISDERLSIKDNFGKIVEYPYHAAVAYTNFCCNFNAEPETADALKWAGFTVLNFANNHSGNAGIKGIEDTLYNLQSVGINYVGAGFNLDEAHKPYIFEKNGIRIAVLGYSDMNKSIMWEATENQAGVAQYRADDVRRDIELTKPYADIIVVSYHFGIEGDFQPSDEQIKTSHQTIDNGAHIVVGHHPHVIQPVEVYKDGVIAYSLGNFVFDPNMQYRDIGGMLEVFIDNDKNIYSIERHIKINEYHQPVIQY
jgi:poly-gamma-glutamate synthesis protein (capsule biosynthesis protein)